MATLSQAARTELAVASRKRDPERIAAARAGLIAANIETAIQANVNAATPLSEAQITRLSALLRGEAA